MTRKIFTPADIIDMKFDQLKSLVNNLLINNRNFKSGYYFRTYPSTSIFVRHVLRDQAEHIIGRIEQLQDDVMGEIEELEKETVQPASEEGFDDHPYGV